MFKVKVRNYEGRLIMILHQTTEHRGDEEVHLYKVIIEINDYETITIERIETKEISIY